MLISAKPIGDYMSGTYIQRGMTSQFAARYLLADVSELAETARNKHELTPKAGRLMAESMAASVLMSSQIKGTERLTIQIEGNRPKFAFICVHYCINQTVNKLNEH